MLKRSTDCAHLYSIADNLVAKNPSCGKEVGLFINIRKCHVLYLHGGLGAWAHAPYLDKHGEPDPNLRFVSLENEDYLPPLFHSYPSFTLFSPKRRGMCVC